MSGRERLGMGLAAGVLVILVCAGMVQCRMEELGQTASVYYTKNNLSERDLIRIMQNKQNETRDANSPNGGEGDKEEEGNEKQEEQRDQLETLAAFQRYERELVKSSLGKSSLVSLYEISGDGRAAMPMQYIRGNALLQKDRTGCVLDRRTAYQLYGSLDVLGQSVEWKGQLYYIRGIVKSDERLMLICTRAQEGSQVPVYSHLEIRLKRQNDSSAIMSFLDQCQISNQDVVVNGIVINQTMAGVIWLPVWVLFVTMLGKLLRMWSSGTRFGSNVALWAAAAAFLALLYGHFPNPAVIPLDNIPSQWSDFLFYRTRWIELADWLNQISQMQRLPKDAAFLKLWLMGMLLTGTGMILAAAAVLCIPKPGGDKKGSE